MKANVLFYYDNTMESQGSMMKMKKNKEKYFSSEYSDINVRYQDIRHTGLASEKFTHIIVPKDVSILSDLKKMFSLLVEDSSDNIFTFDNKNNCLTKV